MVGLEPTTLELTAPRSTFELHPTISQESGSRTHRKPVPKTGEPPLLILLNTLLRPSAVPEGSRPRRNPCCQSGVQWRGDHPHVFASGRCCNGPGADAPAAGRRAG